MRSRINTAVLIALVLAEEYALLFVRKFHNQDARLIHSTADIGDLFSELGVAGRQSYFLQEFVVLSLIVAYTALLLKLVRAMYQRKDRHPPASVYLLCLAPGFWDVVETSGIMVLLKEWPDTGATLTRAITVATPLKWSAGLVLAIFIAWRTLKSPARNPSNS